MQLLKEFPNSASLYNIIGSANQGLGMYGKAIEAYSKALSIKPDYADAYNNVGVTLQDQETNHDEAIEAYTIKQSPSNLIILMPIKHGQ